MRLIKAAALLMACCISFVTIAPSSFADHGNQVEVVEILSPTCKPDLTTPLKSENELLENGDQDQNQDYIPSSRNDLAKTCDNIGYGHNSEPALEHDQVFPEADLPVQVENPEQVYSFEMLEPAVGVEKSRSNNHCIYSYLDEDDLELVIIEQNDFSGLIAFEEIDINEPDPPSLFFHDGFIIKEAIKSEAEPIIQQAEVRTVFEISKAEDFQLARDNPGSSFVVTGNISLDNEKNWAPIGTLSSPFSGYFNGQGFTISDLLASSNENYLGLFGYTSGAILENIHLETVKLTGNEFVGGLVGQAKNTIIRNCSVSGVISGKLDSVGGLVGKTDKCTITDSSTTVAVSGEKGKVGGLVGFAYQSNIVNSSAVGTVTGQGNMIGGLIGLVQATTIATSYADTSVTGADFSSGFGGLVGMLFQNSTILNSYATGVVRGGTNVGGLVGEVSRGDKIINSYASVDASSATEIKCRLIGKSHSETTVTDSYWDLKSNETDEQAGAEARTTEEMKKQENYVGWDFINTWFIEESVTSPLLRWQLPGTDPVVPGEPPIEDPIPIQPGEPDNPAAPANPSEPGPGNMLPGLRLNQIKSHSGYNYASISWKAPPGKAFGQVLSFLNLFGLIYNYLEQAEMIIESIDNGELTAGAEALADVSSNYYWAELYFLIYHQRYSEFERLSIEKRLDHIRQVIEKYQVY